MNWLAGFKFKLIATIFAALAFIGLRLHDRRQGAIQNERKRDLEDAKAAQNVGEAARAARARADADDRTPDERVRGLGGLRDGGSGRG